MKATLEAMARTQEALPEPTFDALRSYAEGNLSDEDAQRIEALLKLRPELRWELEAVREPDPELVAAAWAGFRKAVETGASVARPDLQREAQVRDAKGNADNGSGTGRCDIRTGASSESVQSGASSESVQVRGDTGASSALHRRRTRPGKYRQHFVPQGISHRARHLPRITAAIAFLAVALTLLPLLRSPETMRNSRSFDWPERLEGLLRGAPSEVNEEVLERCQAPELTCFRYGEEIPITLRPPRDARYATLLNVSGRSATIVKQLEVFRGQEKIVPLRAEAEVPVEGLLVLVYTDGPVDELAMVQALNAELASGPLLTAEPASARPQRVISALETLDLAHPVVDVSGAFLVVRRP